MYNVLEEIKDIQYSPPFMFTVRDHYVTVTEIRPGELRVYLQFISLRIPNLCRFGRSKTILF